ncbi:MAG: hypothetical protein AAFX57_01025 [Bacteroidota bacterium]
MKKLLSLLAAVGVMFALSSCGDDDDDDGVAPNNGVTITGIPATASIDNLGTLGPVTATVTGADGLAELVITQDGAAFETVTLSGTSATYDFSYTAVAADEDSNIVFEFTATDIDGDAVSVTHVLSVGAAAVVPTEFDVTENITANTTWTTGNVYNLEARVTVVSGVTLTIEPGVIIKGGAGTGANSKALLVARGATLNAVGTATQPIIMTSVADNIEPGEIVSPNLTDDVNGLWGGLIVLGNARISADNESEQIEGIPASDANGLYGGTNDADNSGTIQYVSVRHGGTNIGEGNEINGITLGGVGSATTIDHVEVVGNADDGIEWFGGTVDVTAALVWSVGDDAIDTDQAWAGTLDNFIVINPGDEAFELDGPEGSYEGAGHTLTNGSVRITFSASGLIDLDDNTDVTMSNIYFFDLYTGEVDQNVEGYDGFIANTNGFDVTSIQSVLPVNTIDDDGDPVIETDMNGDPVNGTLSPVFGNLESEVTAVEQGMNTVGATVSEFSFTLANASGALDDF